MGWDEALMVSKVCFRLLDELLFGMVHFGADEKQQCGLSVLYIHVLCVRQIMNRYDYEASSSSDDLLDTSWLSRNQTSTLETQFEYRETSRIPKHLGVLTLTMFDIGPKRTSNFCGHPRIHS